MFKHMYVTYQDPLRRVLLFAIVPLSAFLLLAMVWPALLTPLQGVSAYPLFHTLVEGFSVLVATLIFVIGWHAASRPVPVSIIVLAATFLGVGLLDLAHLLTFVDTPLYANERAVDVTIWLWLGARLLAALGLLLAIGACRQQQAGLQLRWIAVAAVILPSMMFTLWVLHPASTLPVVFDPVNGLTPLKQALEVLIIVLHVTTAWLLLQRAQDRQPYHVAALFGALLILALSGVWFVLYSEVDDAKALMGHLYKLTAFVFLFRAVFSETIEWPYRRLSESEQQLHATLDAVPDLLFHVTADGRYRYVHSSDPVLPQRELEQRMGRTLADFVQGDAYREFMQALHVAEQHGLSRGRQFCLEVSGRAIWYELSVARKSAADGEPVEFVVACRDVTERRRAETELRLAAAAFETQVAIMVTNARQQILRVNNAFTRITGYTFDDVKGKTPRILSSGMQDAGFYREMYARLEADGQWEGEIWNRRKNGELYPEHLNISVVRDTGGAVEYYVANFGDLTLAKQAEERIHTLAFFDSLTNLPNRRMLLDHISRAQLQAASKGRAYWALLFVDLDNFKTLNDTRGHAVGDLMLKRAAERIKSCTRGKDVVARPGGDEFAILLNGLSHDVTQAARASQEVAAKVLEQVSKPYFLDGHSYITTASVGVTIFNDDVASNDELLSQAELAMYRAKELGGNAYSFFAPEMHQAAIERSHLEADLREALQRREFELYYQPKVRRNGTIAGFEVLLRWRHPRRGMVSPADFIPLAEATGLIVPMGEWVLTQVCEQLAIWQGDKNKRQWTLAVNISERQLSQESFVDRVNSTLQRFGLTQELAGRLEFEITESMLMQNMEQAVNTIRTLNELGIHFAMDDFGTGYSSLNYLKMLPLDCVKVDQSFVRDMLVDQGDAAIVEMVIALAKTLELTVVAEGVETREQHQMLVALGCDQMQGYFYGRPLPLAEMISDADLHQLTGF